MSASAATSVPVLVDRLTSASLASDAVRSLEALGDAVAGSYAGADGGGPSSSPSALASDVASDARAMTALCALVGSAEVERDHGAGPLAVEDGPRLACEVVLSLLGPERGGGAGGAGSGFGWAALVKSLLSTPAAGMLVRALLDRLCPAEEIEGEAAGGDSAPGGPAATYPRTLSLSVLRRLLAVCPGPVQSQLAEAPDGLNRLIGLLGGGGAVPEELRNDALLLLTDLARTSSGCARLVIFSEGYDRALAIATNPISDGGEGGLAGGNCAVLSDCLGLCLELTRSDEMGAEVLLGGRALLDRIGGLLDLRGGRSFRNPAEADGGDLGAGGDGGPDDDDDDDLDDILNGGGASEAMEGRPPKRAPVPRLTEAEESVVGDVLSLLAALVGEEDEGAGDDEGGSARRKMRSRRCTLIGHEGICRLLLDMALFAHPPPGAPYPHGAPSLSLQCRALDTVALLARDAGEDGLEALLSRKSVFLWDVGVIERVMYMICTGGGSVGSSFYGSRNGLPTSSKIESQIAAAQKLSVHALSVLRSTLTGASALMQMSHALAPPTVGPGDDDAGLPPMVPEVTKLVNTLAENLQSLEVLSAKESDATGDGKPAVDEDLLAERGRMVVCAVGSASALGAFLSAPTGDNAGTARELMLRVALPQVAPKAAADSAQSKEGGESKAGPNNILECVLLYLELASSSSDESGSPALLYDPSLACVLLRLLSDWIGLSSTPKDSLGSAKDNTSSVKGLSPVVASMLSSPSSVVLGSYLRSPPPAKKESVKQLAAVLLGLALEELPPDTDVGGWTRDGIMTLIVGGKGGASRYTSLLEGLISEASSQSSETAGPWMQCNSERDLFSKSFADAVRVVRRRVVQQLAARAGGDEEDSDDNDNELDLDKNASSKSLARLLARQSVELDNLRDRLAEAEDSNADRTRQLERLRRRVESNPTQLDEMLTELAEENEKLIRASKAAAEVHASLKKETEQTLQSKDSQIKEMRQDLSQSQNEAIAVAQQRDGLQAEMGGLSAAYSSLESEYNRIAGGSGQEGQISDGGGVNEVSSLAIENGKLRTDVRAANDWMAMAVERMEKLDKRNAELEAAAGSGPLRSQIESCDAEESVLVDENIRLKKECKLLQNKLESNEAADSSEIISLKTQIEGLQTAAKAAQEWMQNAFQHHDVLSSEIESLKKNNSGLKIQLGELQSTESASMPTREDSTTIDSLKMELASAREELRSAEANSDDELSSLRAELSMLQESLDETTRINIDLSKENDGAEALKDAISSRDKEISELREVVHTLELASNHEASVDNEDSKDAGIALLTAEVEQLRASSSAAQEWMKGAVEHAEKLTRANVELGSKVEDLENLLAAERKKFEQAHEVDGKEPEADLTALREETEALRNARDKQEIANEKLKLHVGELQEWTESATQRIADLETENEILSSKMVAREEEDETLSESQNEKLSLQQSLDRLEQERQKHLSTIDELRRLLKTSAEINNTTAVNDFRTELDSEKEKTIEQLEITLSERNSSLADLTRELSAARQDLVEKSAERASTNIDGLQKTLAEIKTRNEELEAALQDKDAILTRSEKELVDLKQEHTHKKAEESEGAASLRTKVKEQNEHILELETDLAQKITSMSRIEDEIVTLRENLAVMSTQSEDAVRQWQERAESLDGEVANLEAQIEAEKDEADEAILKWNERCSLLEAEVASAEEIETRLAKISTENDTFRRELQSKEDSIEQLQSQLQLLASKAAAASVEEMNELRSTVNRLESEKESVSNNSIALGQEIHSLKARNVELEAESNKIDKLEKDFHATTSELSTIREQLSLIESKGDFDALRKELDDKNASFASIENQLRDKQSELTEAVRNIDALKNEIAELSSQSEDAVAQWKDRVDELECSISDLESQLYLEQMEATGVIAEWETRYSTLESEIQLHEEASQELNEVRAKLASIEGYSEEKDEEIDRLKKAVDDVKRKEKEREIAQESVVNLEVQLKQREAEIEAIKKQLAEVEEESETVIVQWKERAEELESAIGELEASMGEQEADADAVIEQWENRCTEHEEQIEDLEKKEALLILKTRDLEAVESERRSALEETSTKIAAMQIKICEDQKKIEDMRYEKASLQETLADECSKASIVVSTKSSEIERLKGEMSSLKCHVGETGILDLEMTIEELTLAKEKAEKELCDERFKWDDQIQEVQKENQSMKEYIGELEDELEHTLGVMQPRVTDEISTKAAEMATGALRQQILEMRSQQTADLDTLTNERHLREKAEIEIRQLRSILDAEGLSVHCNTDSYDQNDEVDKLRRSLDRVTEEISASKEKLRAAEESASASQTYASASAEEARRARSDLATLKHAFDEMRDSDISARASLEHRIAGLEEDKERLSRLNLQETDALNAEIVQLSIEKERLAHSMKESQRVNGELTFSAPLDETVSQTELEREIAKLRIEKAQLLAAASEVGARTEHRIREAVAAATSSIEAQVILERELREASEVAVDDMRAQLDELKSKRVLMDKKETDNNVLTVGLSDLNKDKQNELMETKSKERKLERKVTDLVAQLENADASAKRKIARLEQQVRVAETKAREIEREGRYEIAVAAEISRLRAETLSSEAGKLIGKDEHSRKMSAEQVYDFVLDLRSAIEDERMLYQQLLAEHDDLLGLVAQLDIELAGMREALANISGQEAVDDAAKEAERRAVQKFGKFVQMR